MAQDLSNAAASCARLFAAFAGSAWAGAEDRALAARLEQISPGCGEVIQGAGAFHQRAARWSVGRGAGGGIICGAGLPADPLMHVSATGTVFPGRWVLVDPSPEVTAVSDWILAAGTGGRVTAITGTGTDPEDILRRPETVAIPAPLSVHARLVMQFHSSETAEQAIAGWARLLPAGSVLAISVWLASPSPEGQAWADAHAEAAVNVYAHTEADVRGWLDVPRLTVYGSWVRRCAAGGLTTAIATVG